MKMDGIWNSVKKIALPALGAGIGMFVANCFSVEKEAVDEGSEYDELIYPKDSVEEEVTEEV